MTRFFVGQKLINAAAGWGGEVIEVSDDNHSGVVRITDHEGRVIDNFRGTAAALFGPGKWMPARA